MLGAANSTGVCDGLVLAVPVEIPGRRADGGRREVVSAADADGDAGDDRRRAYGGPRTRGRTSRDVTAGRKGGLPSRGGARVRTTDRRGDFGDTRRAVESGHLIYFRNRRLQFHPCRMAVAAATGPTPRPPANPPPLSAHRRLGRRLGHRLGRRRRYRHAHSRAHCRVARRSLPFQPSARDSLTHRAARGLASRASVPSPPPRLRRLDSGRGPRAGPGPHLCTRG